MIKFFKPLIKDTTHSDVKRLQPLVNQINALEPEIQTLSDSEVTSQFTTLKEEVRAKYGDLATTIQDPDELKKQAQKLLDTYFE